MNSRIRWASIFLALALLVPALAQASGTVPAGAKISVVTDQSVSSKTAKAGQTVTGSVEHDVTVDGKVVIPKGSAAKLTVSSVQASGRLSTPAKLYLRLRTVTVGGKTYTIATSSAGRTEGGKGKRDAGFIGGGAAGGAIIGQVPPEEQRAARANGMPGSSEAARQAARLLERSLEAARAQRSEQGPGREPERPVQRRRERRTSGFPPKQGWRLRPGRP